VPPPTVRAVRARQLFRFVARQRLEGASEYDGLAGESALTWSRLAGDPHAAALALGDHLAGRWRPEERVDLPCGRRTDAWRGGESANRRALNPCQRAEVLGQIARRLHAHARNPERMEKPPERDVPCTCDGVQQIRRGHVGETRDG
jgi:hypothetical protein